MDAFASNSIASSFAAQTRSNMAAPNLGAAPATNGIPASTAFSVQNNCTCSVDPQNSNSAVDAAQGANSLVAGGGAADSLQTALARLEASVAELKRAVEEFAQRVAQQQGMGGAASNGFVQGGGGVVQQSPAQVAPVAGGSPVKGGGIVPTQATSRLNAIPELQAGQSENLRLARGQVTYRQVSVQGGASGTTIQIPTSTQGMQVEVYALRDYQKGAHSTQVLEPLNGSVTIPAGQTVQLITRIRPVAAGNHSVDIGGARINVEAGNQAIDALPMMAWVNETNGSKRGASATSISGVLAHFGVAATGASGVTVTSASKNSPVQYFSAAYEAATKQNPAEVARRIVEAERSAKATGAHKQLWVQVSDEQDKTASEVNGTVAWISQLRAELAKYGSSAKLFVATQARPENLAYASVVDGWATTQSAAGRSRQAAISDIQRASQTYGRNIELMEYPGNAFFDAGTVGSPAISTASAALDGASSWFLYSANNLDVLEAGGGDEGRGDIGGLVVVDGGRVLPTIALIEAELGANLGSAARTFGATNSSGAAQVATKSSHLDAYKHTGGVVDLRAWEREIGSLIR